MSRAKAIKNKCLDCGGSSPKEVTLCHIVDCHLWPYRCGCTVGSKQYQQRMESAKERYPEEYEEMVKLLAEGAENRPNLLEFVQIHAVLEKKADGEYDSMHLEIAA